ncbi:MAG: type II CRISPR RNA-guided endonuclease Cas9 [Nitrospinales bacterium]
MKPQKYRLGLDLGTNSLGWCVLGLNSKERPANIIDGNSRIFSDGRDPKGTSLAVDRRIARGTRRRRDRYIRRRKCLMNRLIALELMPLEKTERKTLENKINPYEIRAKALDEALTPFELGRALFHLNQRRGFKSNLKTASKEEKSKIAEDLQGLQSALEKSFSRTLGEYLWQRHQKGQLIRARKGEKLYPKRMHYETEFDEIRKKQSPYHPNLKNSDWDDLKKNIFYQRDLKSPEPGYCRFVEGEHRAPHALPCFQKFSIAQDLANLELIYPEDRRKERLTEEQRNLLWFIFNKQKAVTFKKIKTVLKLPDGIEFNLETDRRKELKGNQTAKLLSDKEYFGNKWNGLGDEKQNEIVLFFLEAEEEESVINRATSDWGLSEEQAKNLADLTPDDFPKGYARFSRTALQKLWPPMLEEGLTLDKAAAIHGWSHSDTYPAPEDLLPRLKYYGELLPESVVGADSTVALGPNPRTSDEIKRWGRIGNPSVHIGLNQLRLVVNAIIDRYGPPTEIVIELARELKLNKDQKDNLKKEQFKNQKRNKEIAKTLEELKIPNNGLNREKYKLWEELNPQDCNDRKCPFSGETISATMVFSPQVEIEHILPFSRTRDDSMSNRTLSMKSANQAKGNRSPYEAFGHEGSNYSYEDILERVKNMPGNKKWRFQRDAMERFEDEGGFLDRQLNDTRYLSKTAKKYLSHICDHKKVWSIPGVLTALLRRKLGLQKGVKNRNDHRHHAVDALVTALTDRSLLKEVSSLSEMDERKRIIVKEPWPHFNKDVEEWLNRIIVSHRPDHSIAGQLHEGTNYGILENPSDWERQQDYNLVCSKAVEALTVKELEAVRDEDLRRRLLDATYQIEEKKAFQQALANFSADSGIKRVRVLKKDKTVIPIKHPLPNPVHRRGVIPGQVHHVAFWRLPDGKIAAKGLSLFEANQKNKGDPRPHPAAKLILKIHKGDMLRLKDQGKEKTVRVVSLSPENKQLWVTEHQEGGALMTRYTKDKEKVFIFLSFSKLKESQVRKIHVDALGRVRDPGPIL